MAFFPGLQQIIQKKEVWNYWSLLVQLELISVDTGRSRNSLQIQTKILKTWIYIPTLYPQDDNWCHLCILRLGAPVERRLLPKLSVTQEGWTFDCWGVKTTVPQCLLGVIRAHSCLRCKANVGARGGICNSYFSQQVSKLEMSQDSGGNDLTSGDICKRELVRG